MPKRISLQLSKEQEDQVKQATGKDAEAIELTVEELEERIAPSKVPTFRGVEGEQPPDPPSQHWIDIDPSPW